MSRRAIAVFFVSLTLLVVASSGCDKSAQEAEKVIEGFAKLDWSGENESRIITLRQAGKEPALVVLAGKRQGEKEPDSFTYNITSGSVTLGSKTIVLPDDLFEKYPRLYLAGNSTDEYGFWAGRKRFVLQLTTDGGEGMNYVFYFGDVTSNSHKVESMHHEEFTSTKEKEVHDLINQWILQQ